MSAISMVSKKWGSQIPKGMSSVVNGIDLLAPHRPNIRPVTRPDTGPDPPPPKRAIGRHRLP